VDVLTLLHDARTAGLTIRADGDRLVVRGPRPLEWLTELLSIRKADVMAVLTQEQDPVIRRALEAFEGRIYSPPPAPPPTPRPKLPDRGTRVCLELVELPALNHGAPPEANDHELARHRRENCARRARRLERLDGAPTGSGLFVGVEEATSYARAHGWHVSAAN
jgi:hypothetical protein